MTEDSKGYQGR